MIIYPAIDLKDGKCVRLYRGDMEQATIFNHSPVNQALIFQKQGFEFLHIVDLDGAIAGKSANEKSIREIIKNISIPTQLGGGIRSLSMIDKWLQLGINRVILGTVALQNPDLVKEAAKKFPNKIVIAIDAKNGMVATEGWIKSSSMSIIDLAKIFKDAGVAAIIYTDINSDGTGQGTDLVRTKELVKNIAIPIIASGGVGSINDVFKVKKLGVNGLIIGRALYDKKIDFRDLQSL
jgi:phosphoribosylformimino-5-aminoimidazole carboxamide ribotide isomerase